VGLSAATDRWLASHQLPSAAGADEGADDLPTHATQRGLTKLEQLSSSDSRRDLSEMSEEQLIAVSEGKTLQQQQAQQAQQQAQQAQQQQQQQQAQQQAQQDAEAAEQAEAEADRVALSKELRRIALPEEVGDIGRYREI